MCRNQEKDAFSGPENHKKIFLESNGFSRKIIFLLALLTALILPFVSAQSCTNEECAGKVCIFYFYSPDCVHCQETKPFIDSLENDYSQNIVIHRYNVKEVEGFNLYNKFCSIQQIPSQDRGIPLAVIGSKFFMGPPQIKENLEPEIQNAIALNLTECPMPDICTGINSSVSEPILNVSKVTLPLIAVAAAADSINPCAIGVLIFLLSFLIISSKENVKRTGRIASIYIIAVYLAYLFAGIGILTIISKISFLHSLTKILALVIALFGIINIRDAFRGKTMLKIPEKAKPLIEKWVYRASLPAAIVLGIIVAAVELPCTGGMYLAILALLSNMATKDIAFIYLLIYNFIFVLPLIIITVLFIKGVDAGKMHAYIERHKKKSRMIMGIALIALGAVLFFLM